MKNELPENDLSKVSGGSENTDLVTLNSLGKEGIAFVTAQVDIDGELLRSTVPIRSE